MPSSSALRSLARLLSPYAVKKLTGLSIADPVVMQVAETISLEQTMRQVQASMGRSRTMLRPR